MDYIIEIHDPSDSDALICTLENAYTISYSEAINATPTLSFSLPADDDKSVNITKANEIWLRNYKTGVVVKTFRLGFRGDIRV